MTKSWALDWRRLGCTGPDSSCQIRFFPRSSLQLEQPLAFDDCTCLTTQCKSADYDTLVLRRTGPDWKHTYLTRRHIAENGSNRPSSCPTSLANTCSSQTELKLSMCWRHETKAEDMPADAPDTTSSSIYATSLNGNFESTDQEIQTDASSKPGIEQNDNISDNSEAPLLNGHIPKEDTQPGATDRSNPLNANGHISADAKSHGSPSGLEEKVNRNASQETPKPPEILNGSAPAPDASAKPKRGKPKKKNKNYAVLHSKPLPLEVHPLPAFHPTNPISLLKLCYVWLSQVLSPPSSHPPSRYSGYFSAETRSVHVTDPAHVRALWEMGFFGKGTLSRSEPSWLDRAKAKAQELRSGGTAEEATNARREERRLFKLERARLEREKIERQRAVEEGRMTAEEAAAIEAALEEKDEKKPEGSSQDASSGATKEPQVPIQAITAPTPPRPTPSTPAPPSDQLVEGETVIANEEHLQLTLEEAFFLSYGLGVLDVSTTDLSTPSSSNLLNLFAAHAPFPPTPHRASIPPDNHFLLNYVVYHHFRSLGWVVRSGLKFSCDYLLYQRGPVFSHAEFALLIIPSYSNAYWKTERGVKERRWKEKDWWWLHCVNRVQSQVKKTLVLVYVEVPAPHQLDEVDVGTLLKGYEVREFVMRRWIANRSRD